jgi:hypothetical protein
MKRRGAEPPAKTQTVLVSAMLFILTLSLLRLAATKLASTEIFTIVGGFISSLLFFFGILTVGNLENETGWIEVFGCLFVALIAAASVHRVCVTTCFLFSAGILYVMNKVSQRVYKRKSK